MPHVYEHIRKEKMCDQIRRDLEKNEETILIATKINKQLEKCIKFKDVISTKQMANLFTHSWSRFLLEKLRDLSWSFYENWRFISAFVTARHISLSRAKTIQSIFPSKLLQIHFNIILPSTPGSSKWYNSLRCSH
jgi:hypothetical protein